MQVSLYLGSALLAFGPFLSLFALIVYQKAQLVIVVTTAAFFFLLGSLVASIFYVIFDAVGLGGALSAIIPGVLGQFLARCGFVSLYHKVEAVIQESMQRHEEQEQNEANNSSSNDSEWAQAAKLRLSLNDASCGIAAGVGFGGMHSILMYGSLLAAQISNGVGVLYQDACPQLPSLLVSGIFCVLFFLLDLFAMLFTFFGVRRRKEYARGQASRDRDDGRVGAYFGNSRHGGNLALLTALLTHMTASLLTTANWFDNGCIVSLPSVAGVVLVTAYVYWMGCGRIYMPDAQVAERLRSDGPHVD